MSDARGLLTKGSNRLYLQMLSCKASFESSLIVFLVHVKLVYGPEGGSQDQERR